MNNTEETIEQSAETIEQSAETIEQSPETIAPYSILTNLSKISSVAIPTDKN